MDFNYFTKFLFKMEILKMKMDSNYFQKENPFLVPFQNENPNKELDSKFLFKKDFNYFQKENPFQVPH